MNLLKQGHISTEKPDKNRIFDLMRIGLYTLCFLACIFHLNEHSVILTSSIKELQSTIGLLFLALIIWTMQRVSLFNWQSLVVTFFVLIGCFIHGKVLSPLTEVHLNIVLHYIVLWMILMIPVDFAVRKKYRKWNQYEHLLFGLLCLFAIANLFFAPINSASYIYCCLTLVCILGFEFKEWDRVVYGLLNGGFLAFVAIIITSIAVFPFGSNETVHLSLNSMGWSGCFPNSKAFSCFLGLSYGLALVAMFYAKEKKGRFSIRYLLAFLWFIGTICCAYLNGSLHLFWGMALVLSVLFVFGWKKASKKGIIIRGTVVIALFAIISLVYGRIIFQINYTKGNHFELIYSLFGIFTLLIFWVIAVIRYVKTNRKRYFFAMIMPVLSIGMWIDNTKYAGNPLVFIGFFSILSVVFSDNESEEIIGAIKEQIEGKGKYVFCIGCKSIGRYGGFESFIKGLIEQDTDTDTQYFVSCKANGEGCMDLKDLSGAKRISDDHFIYKGAVGFFVPINDNLGAAQAIQYDIESLKMVIDFIRKYQISNAKVYIMACRIGPFLGRYARIIHRLGGRVYINPDGHEWKRSKWPMLVREYWKYSERLMVKNADLIVCDSLNIENYIIEQYKKYNPQTVYIAYGVDGKPSYLSDEDELYKKWLEENAVKPGEYYVGVGRFVPENNFEVMIREYMRSKTRKKVIFITTANQGYYKKLNSKLHFSDDNRICFAGTVYNTDLLKKIREKAYGYLHGHEVGGTNPSLLESLASTDINLLFDVGFNEEVARDAAFYWTKEEGCLAHLIDNMDNISSEEREIMGKKAQQRIKEVYCWNYIVEKYEKIWE